MESYYEHNNSDDDYEAREEEEEAPEFEEVTEEPESDNAEETSGHEHSGYESAEDGDEREADGPTSDYERDPEADDEEADDTGTPPMPPSGVQNYGPHFQGANNKDVQPFFQYSQCTGNKKALFIGINYFGQEGELHGCINDVHNIRKFVTEKFGYQMENVVSLTDDVEDPNLHPTRDNIIQAMYWLVSDAQPNDSLFFHYSGHGGQEVDEDGEEQDEFDETICPEDYQTAGMIIDDELHDILVKPLPAGCRLTAIFDVLSLSHQLKLGVTLFLLSVAIQDRF